METRTENATSHRVEVSGWNVQENFFVEKTMLDRSVRAADKIERHARVAPPAVVFVRLVDRVGGSDGFPIPYHAVESSARRDGCAAAAVQQPQMAFQETANARTMNR